MTMHSEAEEIPASPLVSRVGWQVRTFLITESSRRRIVDAGRGAGGEQPRGRGERVIALALRFIVAVGAAALLGQHVVAAVDDQRGVVALQRVRVALLVQVTVASACRNSAGVAGRCPLRLCPNRCSVRGRQPLRAMLLRAPIIGSLP